MEAPVTQLAAFTPVLISVVTPLRALIFPASLLRAINLDPPLSTNDFKDPRIFPTNGAIPENLDKNLEPFKNLAILGKNLATPLINGLRIPAPIPTPFPSALTRRVPPAPIYCPNNGINPIAQSPARRNSPCLA